MLRAILIFCLVAGALHAQNNAAFTEQLARAENQRSDSLKLAALESINRRPLNRLQQLHLDVRIVKYASRIQQFQKAIALGNASLAKLAGLGLDSLEAAFNLQAGAAYYFMDQRSKALVYFEKAAALAHKSGAWYLENKCLNNIGGVYTDLNEPAKAEPALSRAITLMNEHGLGNDYGTLLSYRVLGDLYTRMGQDQKAKHIYVELLENAAVKKDSSLLADVLLYYAGVLLREGKTDSAVAVSEKAMQYSEKKMFHERGAFLAFRAKILASAGRYKEAYELQGELNTLLRKSFTKDLDKRVSELEVKYKTEELKREKEKAEEAARQQRRIYLLAFGSILLLAAGIIYFLNQKRAARQRTAAHQQRLSALIEGEEKERERIARDLHDGIVQDLTAIKHRLNTAGQDASKLPEVISDLDRATREVRDIAYQMMPVALRDYGLVAALEQLLNKTLLPNTIAYEFEPVNLSKRLPEKIEVCLYRITQELLNNVIKHSKASVISLVISRYQEAVTLVLEDNGTGFREPDVQKGLGLNNLSSRLEMVKGQLKFESLEGSGTMAIIKIPLD